MKKYILPIVIAVGLSGAVLAVPSEDKGKGEKVTICHATSDPGHYNRIVVAEQAQAGHFENNGTPKAGHEDDILLEGEQECPGVTVPGDPEFTPNPNPVVTPPAPVTPTVPKSEQPKTLPAVGADGL